MEDVPGALLGILPCWRLFPETVRGSAQLIRFFGASDSLSSFNLEFFTHRPCSSPHYVLLSHQWNLPWPVAGSTLSWSHQSRRNSTPSFLCRRPSFSKLFPVQTVQRPLYQNFQCTFLECFVYREVQILCDLVAHWGSRDDFFTSSYFAFTVPSNNKKYIYNGINGASQKEKSQRQPHRKEILKDFQDDLWPARSRLDYDFIYDFYHTCMMEGSNPRELHHNLTATQHRNSALSV